MTNLYTQAERQQRVVDDVYDTTQSTSFWLLDLVGCVFGALFWWR